MKIYLAARYSRKDEIAAKAKQLEHLGFEITSTWWQEHRPANHILADYPESENSEYAVRDVDEVLAAEMLILFSEDPTMAFVRGGRHVEFGLALGITIAGGYPVLIVGPRENLFHYHPKVVQVPDWTSALDYLHTGGF